MNKSLVILLKKYMQIYQFAIAFSKFSHFAQQDLQIYQFVIVFFHGYLTLLTCIFQFSLGTGISHVISPKQTISKFPT